MIGNDVVDLTDPEARPGATHARFDGRVFAPAERALLAESRAPQRLRWRLWAAKEAAYKVARKLDARAVFAPSRFVVRLEGGGRGVVRYGAEVFAVWIDEAEDHVHAAAAGGDHRGRRPVMAARSAAGASLSAAARSLAVDTLARVLGEDPRSIAIVSRDRIPRARLRGRAAAVDLSLSHHGRLVACAFAPESAA
jgi:phosphopantetheinyl transferase (holo-ACP synthase)